MPTRHSLICATHILMERHGHVLMQRRYNTGYEDGNYSLPAGHVEAGETVIEASIREVFEEIGVLTTSQQLRFRHVMHRSPESGSSGSERVDFFLTTSHWDGVPTIMEPDKADALRWFPLKALPTNTVPYVREALTAIAEDRTPYSEFGWRRAA